MNTTHYMTFPQYTNAAGLRSTKRASFKVLSTGRVTVATWIEYVVNGRRCAGGYESSTTTAAKARSTWTFFTKTLGAVKVNEHRHAYEADAA